MSFTISPETASHKVTQVTDMVVILSSKLNHFLNHTGEQLPVPGGRVCGQWLLLMAALCQDESRNLPTLGLLVQDSPELQFINT